jgi:hypothetical protein
MPRALLTAIVIEGTLAAGMVALAVVDAATAVTSFRHNLTSAEFAFGTCVALLLIAFPLALSALLLSRHQLAGSQLSYIAAILVVLIAVSTALEAGELLLALTLTIASVALVLCVISPSTRLALAPAVIGVRSETSAIQASPIGMRGYPPPELHLSRSRSDTALMVIAGPVFVVGGIWMGLSGLVVGWMTLGVFGPATVAMFSMVVRGYPRLAATPEGLSVATFVGWRTYRWNRVGPFAVGPLSRNVDRVVFSVAPSKASAPISISRALGGVDARLPSNFGMDPATLAAALNQWKDWSAGSGL